MLQNNYLQLYPFHKFIRALGMVITVSSWIRTSTWLKPVIDWLTIDKANKYTSNMEALSLEVDILKKKLDLSFCDWGEWEQ